MGGLINDGSDNLLTGIDLFIGLGTDFQTIQNALLVEADIVSEAIANWDDKIDAIVEIFRYPYFAIIHEIARGDFAYKAGLGGAEPRDYAMIARRLSDRLNIPIACEDAASTGSEIDILYRPGLPAVQVLLKPVGDNGYWIIFVT